MKSIYLDHSATTYVKPEVLQEMLPYFSEKFGNASSVHSYGRDARNAIDVARSRVAKALNAEDREIYFTSCATESDNIALKGFAYANRNKGNHIITTNVEHHAILHTADYLSKNGFEVTYLPVDEFGLISIEQLNNAITEQTILVSIMAANNEIGTIMPIFEIGKLCKEKGVAFHTDAVQAIGNIAIDVKLNNIDMLSLSGHKFYGPKGIGALYVRKGLKFEELQHGGSHEFGKRAGTENVPGIVGLGKAIEMATSNINLYAAKLQNMRDKLIDGVLNNIPNSRLNGHFERRLPGNANFCFDYVKGENLLFQLDAKGIAASSGSACSAGSIDPSHVLLAIGLTPEIANGSLRLTLGEDNREEDVDYVLKVLPEIIEKLRETSPLYAEFLKNKKFV